MTGAAQSSPAGYQMWGVPGLPEIRSGDDLSALIGDAATAPGLPGLGGGLPGLGGGFPGLPGFKK